MCRAAVREITLTNFRYACMSIAKVYNGVIARRQTFFFLDIFRKNAKSYIKANACRAATSDAYDAPVNYRRASGNACDGEHIKSLIYYLETFSKRHLMYP